MFSDLERAGRLPAVLHVVLAVCADFKFVVSRYFPLPAIAHAYAENLETSSRSLLLCSSSHSWWGGRLPAQTTGEAANRGRGK